MSIIFILTSKFNTIPIKIPAVFFFCRNWQEASKTSKKMQRTLKKKIIGRLIPPDFNTYSKSILI